MLDSVVSTARRAGLLLATTALFAACKDGPSVLTPEPTEPRVVANTGPSSGAGSLMLWGDDTRGQVSDVPLGTFLAVAGGSFNGLALRTEGTPVLWGTQDSAIGATPIPPELARQKYRTVAIGRDDAVMIRTDGTLASFGRYLPVNRVPAGTYRAVTVGANFAVAIARDGTLTAWNWPHAQVGPAPDVLNVPAGTFQKISARVLHSLALAEDGTLYGWGPSGGTPGQSGIFKDWTVTRDPKIVFLPGQKFTAIAAGNVHALAIRPDGTVTGWANDTTSTALNPPTHVRFKDIDAGWGFSIGLDTNGTLWGWGTPASCCNTTLWTFENQGWTRFKNTEHFFIPDQRFDSIAAAAFHVMALTAR